MKVKDLKGYVYDKIILYRSESDDFTDIYKGDIDNLPNTMLDLEIKTIGAKRRGIIDIRVE